MGTMPGKISSGLRALLPWAISAGLLAYAFGWATDWQRLVEATERADLPALTESFESSTTPGVFLAGEVTGYALVRTAIGHGPGATQ